MSCLRTPLCTGDLLNNGLPVAFTDINSEDRLVQQTFAGNLEKVLGWESVYAWNEETFGPGGTLGRANEREVVWARLVSGEVAV